MLRAYLALCESVDELLVVQDVALAVAQHEENLVLYVLELLLHLGVANHQLTLQVGKVGPLL